MFTAVYGYSAAAAVAAAAINIPIGVCVRESKRDRSRYGFYER